MIFPYKIADEISKIANYFQTKNKFDENSTWCTLKYPNHKTQNKKVKSFSIIKKLGSFFDFHTKRPKLQNRGMQLLAVILGFGGWNFAGDMIMNHIFHFLLLQLDLTLPKHPNIYLFFFWHYHKILKKIWIHGSTVKKHPSSDYAGLVKSDER